MIVYNFRLRNKKNKIEYYQVLNKLLILSEGNLYLDEKKINYNNISWGALLNEEYILINKDDKQIILNSELDQVTQFDNSVLFSSIQIKNKDVFIVSFDTKYEQNGNIICSWGGYSMNEKKLSIDLNIKTKYCSVIFFGKKQIIFQNLNTITSYNLENGEVLWERKEENGHNNIIGVFQDAIFLPRKDRSIISISIDSGDIIQTWRELPNINKGSKIEGVIPEPKNFVLDKENELLVGRGINTIITIDLKTNNISFVNIDEELKRHNIFALKGISKGAFNSTHLFLTGMMNQTPEDTKFSYDCLFALNRETLQIDWQYNFEEESLGTHKPVLSGNKLYQLDNNKTLHIFEKEEHIN